MASLRVHVLSDLHVDFRENQQRLPSLVDGMKAHPADVLVVAGDVSHKLDQADRTLSALADLAPTRLFVPGNHDVWVVRPRPGDPPDSWARLDALRDLARRHGFHSLHHENRSTGGFTFVGSMLWYDYSYASPALPGPADGYAKKKFHDLTYMDAEHAAWGMPDAAVVDRFLEELSPRLRVARSPIIFVSHHVPREDLILRRGVASWDFFNAYMGSRRFEDLLRARGVDRFIFGHTHRPVALVERERCILNNPLGYPRQALNPVLRPFVIR